MPRTPVTDTYTRRPQIQQVAVDPIQTGTWDDTQTWNEEDKFWLDAGTQPGDTYTQRPVVTDNYT